MRIPDTRLTRIVPAVAWMAVIFALSAQSTIPSPRDLTGDWLNSLGHFSVYLVLGILTWWALGLTQVSGRRRATLAVVIAILCGVTDEWHQSFVPGRTPDVVDIVVDGLGATCGMLLLAYVSRRRSSIRTTDRPQPA